MGVKESLGYHPADIGTIPFLGVNKPAVCHHPQTQHNRRLRPIVWPDSKVFFSCDAVSRCETSILGFTEYIQRHLVSSEECLYDGPDESACGWKPP